MRKERRDDGFGLTEVVISMLLLMIVFLALLTILISALDTVALNATRASAAELAQGRLEASRTMAVTGNCANVKSVAQATENVTDGRGVPLKIVGVVSNCTQTSGSEASQPRLARITVTVTTTQPGIQNPVAVVVSDVYVKFTP